MKDLTAKNMAEKLMGWKLPQDFSPDCFISFDRERASENGSWPTGTNVLTVAQAEKMFSYVLDAPPRWQGMAPCDGMSLRDYFAAKVIPEVLELCGTYATAAKEAYAVADAMIAAREA